MVGGLDWKFGLKFGSEVEFDLEGFLKECLGSPHYLEFLGMIFLDNQGLKVTKMHNLLRVAKFETHCFSV